MDHGAGIATPDLEGIQTRWDKERAENMLLAYRSQLAHAALKLMGSSNGAEYADPDNALEAAHAIFQGVKKFNP